jgi:hypothetical protein
MYWQTTKYCRLWLIIDRPDLSSERVPHKDTTVTNIWSWEPEGVRHKTYWLTDWPSVMWFWFWLLQLVNPMPNLTGLGYLVSGGNKYRNLAFQVGESQKMETIKYACESQWDSDPRKTVLAMSSNNWKLQTWPLIREGATHQQINTCLKKIIKERRKIGRVSQMGAWQKDRLADWPSVVI